MPSAKSSPPWRKPRPKQKPVALTPAMRARAEARAKAAGRTYPNLVDNMWAARQQKKPA